MPALRKLAQPEQALRRYRDRLLMQRALEIIFGLIGLVLLLMGVIGNDHVSSATGIACLAYSKACGIAADLKLK